MAQVVVVGAGQAGLQAAASLRELGFQGAVTLIGDEPVAPYQRPPLSKAYLGSDGRVEPLLLRPERYFADNDIAFLKGARALGLDLTAGTVVLADGRHVGFDHLVMATGTRNRPLPVPGADLPGVMGLRGAEDASRLRAALGTARRVAIVGGGFIGLEVSAYCRSRDIGTVVVEALDRVAARAVSPEISAMLLAHQQRIGADVRLNARVAAVTARHGRASGLQLADGGGIEADLVLACIGVVPNSELAEAAGLAVGNGILVDERLRTSRERVFAIGDCASFPCASYGARIRLESVPNAVEQGRHVAAAILGETRPFRATPWFWSDQGKLKLQMAGPTQVATERVTIGDEHAASVFCFRHGQLIGIECVNRPLDFVNVRRILTNAAPLGRAALEAASFDTKVLLAA